MTRPKVAYYTVDTNVLAPHPNMTHEELNDFEDWAGVTRTPLPGSRADEKLSDWQAQVRDTLREYTEEKDGV